MRITINGESREIAAPLTVAGLVVELGLDPRRVAVELNRRIVKRAEFDAVRLAEGDLLEVVHFVGGG
jgi:thiamine biosynthesis protein ThiS